MTARELFGLDHWNAASINRYDNLKTEGKDRLIYANRLNSSNLNMTISVKIVHRVIKDQALTTLGPFSGIKPDMLILVYGECIISMLSQDFLLEASRSF